MIISSVLSLIIFSICFFIYQIIGEDGFTNPSDPFLWVYVVLILSGVNVGNIRNIALAAIIPLMVKKENLDKANGLAGMVSGLSFFVVSVFSGILVGHSGMFLVLLFAVILTFFSIIHLQTINIPNKQVDDKVKETEETPQEKMNIRETLKIVGSVPGLFPLILFTTFNNFLGGVFMSLMDAYGLSLVSVQVWGFIWGGLSTAFIIGGLYISKYGLGKNPLRTLFIANVIIWSVCCIFTLNSSTILLMIGMFIYLSVAPFIEASEHTIIQRVVAPDKLGRVFGFTQSVEQAASPLTAFAIGPITQLIFIPFMKTGRGVELIGNWFGTRPDRGIALVFTLAGVIGLSVTLLVMQTRFYKNLSKHYQSVS